jgi:hypothetical protein
MKVAATNNVRFSAYLAEHFRFDETAPFMGGEDVEFFGRINAAGYEIKKTLLAETYEKEHPERTTLWGQFYRSFWCAAADLVVLKNIRGIFWAFTRKFHTIPVNILFGVAHIAIALLALPISRKYAKRSFLRGAKKAAKSMGRGAALLGWLPKPYSQTVGS